MNPHDPPPPELAALLAAMADEPEDVSRKLVVADWLEEHGDPRCELFRQAVTEWTLDDWRRRYGDWWPGREVKNALTFFDGTLALRWTVKDHGPPGDLSLPGIELIEQGWIASMKLQTTTGTTSYDFPEIFELRSLQDQLTEIRLNGIRPWQERYDPLRFFERLRTLEWDGDYGQTSMWPIPFRSMIALQHVDLPKLRVVDAAQQLSALDDLRWLRLSGLRNFHRDFWKWLDRKPRLRELRIAAGRWADADFEAVARIETLERLDLHGFVELTPLRIARLAELPRLTTLGLRDEQAFSLDDQPEGTAQRLAELPSLKMMVLSSPEPRALMTLCQALPHCQFVQTSRDRHG